MAKFESQESVFNFAVAYLKKVNELLYIAAEAQGQRDLRRWFDVLRVIGENVYMKFKESEIEELQLMDDKIEKVFRENQEINFGDYKFVIVMGKARKVPNYPLEREQLYDMIKLYQRRILKLADKYGLLLPGKSDPRFAVLER